MKYDVERPARLIDITRLPLKNVEETSDGGLRIGALVPNTDLAYHPLIEQRYPLLASAILAGASQQLRNMASTGGNLLQRTRCFYFYDTATPCNKRAAGQRLLGDRRHQPHQCDPRHERGLHRDASVRHVRRARGARSQGACRRALPASARSRLRISIGCPATRRSSTPICSPTRSSRRSNCRRKGFAANYTYLKIRDRLSYAFALVSVAAALELEGDTIKEARLALGGVAHKPWRRSGGRSGAARTTRCRREEPLRAKRPTSLLRGRARGYRRTTASRSELAPRAAIVRR